MPEDSKENSVNDRRAERTQRAREPYVSHDKVSGALTPATGRQRLDVDAVLQRSIRKVAGEE